MQSKTSGEEHQLLLHARMNLHTHMVVILSRQGIPNMLSEKWEQIKYLFLGYFFPQFLSVLISVHLCVYL